MPRISPQLLRHAARLSPDAATLLPAVRDLPSALNELRWIREHVVTTANKLHGEENELVKKLRVAELCRRRGRGEPLQYVLGTVPFGELDILCRRGVLIPRPEPEDYTTHLAHLLTTNPIPHKHLTILDLCTGTGCIALLLAHLLSRAATTLSFTIQGVDISPHAIKLAHRNLAHNAHHLPPSPLVSFTQGDVFAPPALWALKPPPPPPPSPPKSPSGHTPDPRCDILIANPPYVSPHAFAHQTARSVRNYEPKLAQVPALAPPFRYHPRCHDHPEDLFYRRLLDIAAETRARVLLFEVGDLAQALRVARMAWWNRGLREAWDGEDGAVEVEVWRDWPDAAPREEEEGVGVVEVDGGRSTREVRIRGSGHGRSVFIQCGGGLRALAS